MEKLSQKQIKIICEPRRAYTLSHWGEQLCQVLLKFLYPVRSYSQEKQKCDGIKYGKVCNSASLFFFQYAELGNVPITHVKFHQNQESNLWEEDLDGQTDRRARSKIFCRPLREGRHNCQILPIFDIQLLATIVVNVIFLGRLSSILGGPNKAPFPTQGIYMYFFPPILCEISPQTSGYVPAAF